MTKLKKALRLLAAAVTALALAVAAVPPVTASAAEAEYRWEYDMVRAAEAARTGFDGSGVRVAVIDSGLAPLGVFARLSEGADYTGAGDVSDYLGHGTFIASIIAGSDEAAGFFPIAKGAEIVPLKSFSSGSADTAAAAKAIRDAVDVYGCRVINLSFGQKGDEPEMREAVSYALGKGAVVVAAAGNGGSEDLYYPAAYDGVIAVNSVNRAGEAARDAQRNSSVDIAAPGVGVSGYLQDGAAGKRSGSSFAAPFVAAAAAVLISADQSLSPAEVEALILSNAVDAGEEGRDDVYGYGILDIGASLSALLSERPWLFSDVEADTWFAGAVRIVADAGILIGKAKGIFDPYGEVTRGQFVTVLYRLAGSPEISEASQFADVPEGYWCKDAVVWAAINGMVKGKTATVFDPTGTVTRDQMAVILARGGYKGAGSVERPAEPASAPAVAAWAREGVEYCMNEGLLQPSDADHFDPRGKIDRAALAAVISRLDMIQ